MAAAGVAIGHPLSAVDLRALAWPAVVAAVAVAGVGARLGAGALPIDDAYITFRYARNLADGLGLVYNPGDAVLGTTTPLWATLLAVAHWLTGADIPLIALLLATLADAGTTVLVVRLARRLTGSPALGLLAGLAFAWSPSSVQYARSGMETSVFAFLLLGAFALRWRPRLWPLVAAAATLARPEGGLLALCLLLANGRAGRTLLASLGLYVGLLAPWGLYALVVYGSPVPQSLLAKSAAVYLTDPASGVRDTLVAAVMLATPGLAPLALLLPWGTRRAPPALWAFPTTFLAFHLAGVWRGGLLFGWYLVPLVPWALLLLVRGAQVVSGRVRRPWLAPVLGGLAVLGALLGSGTPSPARREPDYLQAGAYLAATAPRGATVAAPEIGAIGWAVPSLRVLDTVGLVSPEAIRYYPLPTRAAYGPSNAVPAALIRHERPDYILALEVFLRPVLRDDPSALDGYALARIWPSDTFGSRGLLLYRRGGNP